MRAKKVTYDGFWVSVAHHNLARLFCCWHCSHCLHCLYCLYCLHCSHWLHRLNCLHCFYCSTLTQLMSAYVGLFILFGVIRTLLEWADGLLSKIWQMWRDMSVGDGWYPLDYYDCKSTYGANHLTSLNSLNGFTSMSSLLSVLHKAMIMWHRHIGN